eukprot:6535800-Pyramimonas_sp.AAC.1
MRARSETSPRCGLRRAEGTLLWRGATCARQHSGAPFSPGGHRISIARRAFGSPDAGHQNRQRTRYIFTRAH